MPSVSLKNASVNSPWWWKRLESSLLFLIMGLIPLIGLSKSLSPELTHDLTLIYLPGIGVLVKSIGIFFGEDVKVGDVTVEADEPIKNN